MLLPAAVGRGAARARRTGAMSTYLGLGEGLRRLLVSDNAFPSCALPLSRVCLSRRIFLHSISHFHPCSFLSVSCAFSLTYAYTVFAVAIVISIRDAPLLSTKCLPNRNPHFEFNLRTIEKATKNAIRKTPYKQIAIVFIVNFIFLVALFLYNLHFHICSVQHDDV